MSLVESICLVNFHHTTGNVVEWIYPENTEYSELVMHDITNRAMPDQSHKFANDFCYFTSGKYYCVACFQQEASTQVQDDNATRSMVQKSVVAVATKPLFGAIRSMLEPFTRAYFSTGIFSDHSILEVAYTSFNHKFKTLSAQNRDALFTGLELQQFVLKFKNNALLLYKLLLLEKRIIFYGVPASVVSDTLVSLISLLPYYMVSQIDVNLLTEDEKAEMDLYRFPLPIFNNTLYEPYITLTCVDKLKDQKSFLIGTSNPVFGSVVKGDVFVEVVSGTLIWTDQFLKEKCYLSSKDEMFFDIIVRKVTSHVSLGPTNLNVEGSNQWIRTMFKLYTKSLLSCAVDNWLNGSTWEAKDNKDGKLVNPLDHFNSKWVKLWQETENYQMIKVLDLEKIKDNIRPSHFAAEMKTVMEEFDDIKETLLHDFNNFVEFVKSEPGDVEGEESSIFSSVVHTIQSKFKEENKEPGQIITPTEETSYFSGFLSNVNQNLSNIKNYVEKEMGTENYSDKDK